MDYGYIHNQNVEIKQNNVVICKIQSSRLGLGWSLIVGRIWMVSFNAFSYTVFCWLRDPKK